jgi:hypothetical protein
MVRTLFGQAPVFSKLFFKADSRLMPPGLHERREPEKHL